MSTQDNARRPDRSQDSAQRKNSSSSAGNADDVGYGKPPKATRWRKGQSGNPRGRPKKAKPAPPSHLDQPSRTSFETEAYRPITLTEGGKAVTMPVRQALDRSMFNHAIKGNRILAKHLDRRLREEDAAAKEAAETYSFFVDYKRQCAATLARHEAQGTEPPPFYPHPADILVDPIKREVHFLGPMNAESAYLYEYKRLTRDLLLGQSALNQRRSGSAEPDLYLALAQEIHDILPPSYQGGNEIALITEYDGWRALGVREIRARLRDIRRELDALPPINVEAFMEEREEKLRRTKLLGNVLASVFELIGETAANDGPIDSADVDAIVDAALKSIRSG